MDILRLPVTFRRRGRQGRPVIALVEGLERRSLLTATLTAVPVTSSFIAGVTPATAPIVGYFVDSDTSATAANFTASIDWGDANSPKTDVTAGVVNSTATPGLFSVSGPHLYTAPGNYPVKITVNDLSGDTTTISSTASVVSPISATPTSFSTTPGVPLPSGTVVANFTDINPAVLASSSPASLLSATITWGDGTTSAGQVNPIAPVGSGVFTVTGTHLYSTTRTDTSYPVAVTIADPSGQSVTVTSTATVTSPIAASGTTFPATPGVQLTNQPVASFTDSNSNAASSTAIIDWGDGTVGTGTIVPPTGSSTTYTVEGTHTYSAPSPTGNDSVKVTIIDPSGQTVAVTSTAVFATSITATGLTFSTTPGKPLTNQPVATFVDTSATAAASTAVIDWGDGTISNGLVVPPTGSSTAYTVEGTHTYSAASPTGSYTVKVTIADPDGQTATATSTALIATPITATGLTFSTTPGQPLTNQAVATFVDSNANAAKSTAVIDWGDGTTSTGTVASAGSPTTYTVEGTHTYSAASPTGSYTVKVTIADPSGQTATATSTALVATAITATGTTFSTTPGQPVPSSTVLVYFTDSNAGAGSSTAVINWGDGTTSTEPVSANPNGLPGAFVVRAVNSHTYSAASPTGSYTVKVTIADPSGQTATATSTALVITSISATGTTFPTTPGQPIPSSTVLAYFTDSSMGAGASTAVVNWGDGATTTEPVFANPNGVPGAFIVQAVTSHTYSTSSPAGSYTVKLTIIDPSGQTATASSTALVTTPSGVLGGLSNVVTNGPHAARGFTNTNRPVFSGTATPFSIVQIYARPINVDAVMPLGEAVANANGQWTFTSGPLAAGTYIFTATVTIPGGYPSQMMTLQNSNGSQLVYIDLSPALVRRLSHGHKVIPQHHKAHLPRPTIPRAARIGHHRA